MKASFLVVIAFLILFTRATLAATSVSFGTTPATLDYQTEFSTTVNLSCSGCGDSYIRGVFYPSGTSYFGFTQDNSSNWNNSPASLCTNYFKVAQSDLLSGSWSGTLKFKPDEDSPYYQGPGEYLFKVGRYTSSCGSPAWSSEVTIGITGPTLSPSPSVSGNTLSSQQPIPSTVNLNSSSPAETPVKVSSSSASVSGIAKLPKLSKTTASEKNTKTKQVLGSKVDNVWAYVIILGAIMLLVALGIIFKEKIRSLTPF